MQQVERIAFTGAAEAWVPRLDATCRTFLADRTGIVAIGNVTATGPVMAAPLTRAGLLVLFDGGLEVWHRLAVLEQDPVHRYGRIGSAEVTSARVEPRGDEVGLLVHGDRGAPLLEATVRPGAASTDEATAALRRWVIATGHAGTSGEATSLGSVTALPGLPDADVAAVLDRFRSIVDAAVGEVVERLAAHEAELDHLRRREAELTELLTGLRSGRAS